MAGVIFVENDMNNVVQSLQFDMTGEQIVDAVITVRMGDKTRSGKITNATDASPIVVTSPSHGLTNGEKIIVTNVKGNRAANGTWTVANTTTDSFELAGSAGDGAYFAASESGGKWYLAVPGAEAITLTYHDGSGGELVAGYYGQFDRSVPFIEGRSYLAILTCDNYGLQAEQDCVAQIRKF